MMMMTKPPVNLLYLALSHSGVNDVAITSSVPQSMIDKAVDQLRTRLRACANWRLKAIILNICYRSLLNSVVIQSAFFKATHRFQRKTTYFAAIRSSNFDATDRLGIGLYDRTSAVSVFSRLLYEQSNV